MITKQEQKKMYASAPLLGEPACTEIRKVLDALKEAEQELNARKGLRIEIVEAPGDRCGNTKRLANGDKCPGCRACS